MATSPISDSVTRNDYTASAGQTTFAYTFWIKEEDHLDVYVNSVLQTLTTDYTISTTQNVNGGNVVFNSGLTLNDEVAIVYNPDVERLTDFQTSGKFSATDINLELSYIISLLQYLNTQVARTLRLSDPTAGTSTALPAPQAGYLFRWNLAATALEAVDPASISTAIDTNLSGVETDDILLYDGNEFVPTSPAEYASKLNVLTASDDIDFTGDNTFAGKVALKDVSELTIASGVITVTGANHTVDTESDAASDDLDTINGGADGQLLVIRPDNTARTVVIKDGTGNIETQDGEDITLDTTEKAATLIYDAALSKWLVLSPGPAGTVSNASTTAAGIVEKATSAEIAAETADRYADTADMKHHPGVAKAWVNFNGTGTVSIRDSYNVSSITDNGTGDYTINFTNNFANANYTGHVTAGSSTIFLNAYGVFPISAAPTVSAARIGVKTDNNAAFDGEYTHAVFYGDLA